MTESSTFQSFNLLELTVTAQPRSCCHSLKPTPGASHDHGKVFLWPCLFPIKKYVLLDNGHNVTTLSAKRAVFHLQNLTVTLDFLHRHTSYSSYVFTSSKLRARCPHRDRHREWKCGKKHSVTPQRHTSRSLEEMAGTFNEASRISRAFDASI